MAITSLSWRRALASGLMCRRSLDMSNGAAMIAQRAIWVICWSRLRPKLPITNWDKEWSKNSREIKHFLKLPRHRDKSPSRASCSDYSHIKPPPKNFSLLICPGCQVGRKQVHFRNLNQRAQVLTISGSFQPPGPATGTIIFWLEDVQSKVFLILCQES